MSVVCFHKISQIQMLIGIFNGCGWKDESHHVTIAQGLAATPSPTSKISHIRPDSFKNTIRENIAFFKATGCNVLKL
jgi:hypothetical protein